VLDLERMINFFQEFKELHEQGMLNILGDETILLSYEAFFEILKKEKDLIKEVIVINKTKEREYTEIYFIYKGIKFLCLLPVVVKIKK